MLPLGVLRAFLIPTATSRLRLTTLRIRFSFRDMPLIFTNIGLGLRLRRQYRVLGAYH